MKLVRKTYILFILLTFAPQVSQAAILTKYYLVNSGADSTDLTFKISDGANLSYISRANGTDVFIELDNVSWNAKKIRIKHNLIKDVSWENKDKKLKIIISLADNAYAKNISVKSTIFSNITSTKLTVSIVKRSINIKAARANGAPLSLSPEYKSSMEWRAPAYKPTEWKGYGDKSVFREENNEPEPRKKPLSTDSSSYKPIIVIDPGHGGKDSGAVSRNNIYEKKVTLEYATELQRVLNSSGKYKAHLTRTNDSYVTLNGRVKKAQSYGADLFVSIHADSHPDTSTRGLSVYTLSEKRARYEADKLSSKADNENVLSGVDIKDEIRDVRDTIIDMVQRDTKNSSAIFAEILVKELGGEIRLLDKAHRFAGFAVLTGADVPSVLVELGYLTNRTEEKLLRTDGYKKKLTQNMAAAIDKYFGKYNAAHER